MFFGEGTTFFYSPSISKNHILFSVCLMLWCTGLVTKLPPIFCRIYGAIWMFSSVMHSQCCTRFFKILAADEWKLNWPMKVTHGRQQWHSKLGVWLRVPFWRFRLLWFRDVRVSEMQPYVDKKSLFCRGLPVLTVSVDSDPWDKLHVAYSAGHPSDLQHAFS